LEQLSFRQSFRESAGRPKQLESSRQIAPQISQFGTPAGVDCYADDTRAPLMQPASREASHDKLTSKRHLLASRYPYCHARRPLSVTCRQRFKGSGPTLSFNYLLLASLMNSKMLRTQQ